ncbi:MAG: glycosyl hydrolase family 28-related protein [Sandaracinaceae bacterium]
MRRVLVLFLACLGCAGPTPADAGAVDAGVDAGLPPGPWRSALYPEGWTPDLVDDAGRFLHDFSWAGYHHGEAEPGAPASAAVLEVVAYGADPTGGADSTAAIQAAIDEASIDGGVVHLAAGTYRVDGTLRVAARGVVLRGDGPDATRLWLTALSGMAGRAHITFAGELSSDLEVRLTDDGAPRATTVRVADPSGLAVGDDVDVGWVITPDFVEEHAMTGYWMVFDDEWQPFFRRTVVAIDGDQVTLDVPLRYPAKVRDAASLRRTRGWLREVGLEALAIATAGDADEAWAASQTFAVRFEGVADGWVRDVASFPSPGATDGAHLASGGLTVRASKRVTVSDTHLAAAQNLGPGGNGYLFEVRTSSELLYRDCSGVDGRHAFITNWGFGTSGVVWLRVRTAGGRSLPMRTGGIVTVGLSDYHHSLATANLVDSSVLDDGWSATNRLGFSSGAGHGATESVFWNTSGAGQIRSLQWGWGYVIGTAPALDVTTDDAPLEQLDTEPPDWVEGLGRAADLEPSSLYEDQLARRLAGAP